MREWTYSSTYYLIAYVIPVYHLNYCVLIPSEFSKEYIES